MNNKFNTLGIVYDTKTYKYLMAKDGLITL